MPRGWLPCSSSPGGSLSSRRPSDWRVFFNGEECYHVPGEGAYLDAGSPDPAKVAPAINIDGIGLFYHRSGISYYGCPEDMVVTAEQAREPFPDPERTEPWPQGDHMIFQGVPTMAISALTAFGVIEQVIHTPADSWTGWTKP
ncbi:SRPBCC family protein [Methanosphaerula palustris]|uniref:hypothetical protein n=1 Tax=Methanosphaerula palustris TaxID=475088 RepID=UPI00018487BF|nr:hypothetical protein [Methanosphaerula palustris]